MTKKQFAVIGCGRFGQAIALELTRMGHEVLAVDSNTESLDVVAPYVTHAIEADITDEAALASLGIRNFDAVIVAIGGELQASIVVSMLCKELGAKYIVAKSSSDLHSKILLKLGVNKVVFPEHDMGIRLAHSVSSSNVLDILKISNEYSMTEMVVPHQWEGKSLVEVNVRAKYNVNITAIRHQDQLLVSPSPSYVFAKGDIMLCIASNDSIKKLEEKFGM
jgi:trk system potassium uptake protein TrkA